mmetsp:Transcript_16918/g.69072  ORF Transcript_16918/g.69072 Transcript_16918/m.69072 type:complete len:217 (-) Transcript_16918:1503-2153(-)
MEILEQSETRMMEAEFLAEDEMITMLPLVSIPRMTFLQGDYGPLIPGEPIEVPIWFALALKRARKCKLVVPSWMEEKQLEKTVENERISKNRLTPVPYYYAEIASLLLHYASDDMRSAATVRRGVEDLTSLRSSKFRRYLQINVREDCNGIKIENICSGELSTIRPVLCEILETIHRANNSGEVNPIKTQSQKSQGTQSTSIFSSSKPRSLRRFRA